jgi:hypothetical protein
MHAGVLKKTTNEQRQMEPRPSDDWIKIGLKGVGGEDGFTD